MDPGHLEKCLETAEVTGEDYVYPWYRIGRGGHDPLGKFFGKPWDNNQPHETTITTLVRTELAQSVGFKTTWDLTSPNVRASREDWFFTIGCMNAGGKIVHHPERTWTWHHHGATKIGRA